MPRRRLRIPRTGEALGAGRARSRGRPSASGTAVVHAVMSSGSPGHYWERARRAGQDRGWDVHEVPDGP